MHKRVGWAKMPLCVTDHFPYRDFGWHRRQHSSFMRHRRLFYSLKVAVQDKDVMSSPSKQKSLRIQVLLAQHRQDPRRALPRPILLMEILILTS